MDQCVRIGAQQLWEGKGSILWSERDMGLLSILRVGKLVSCHRILYQLFEIKLKIHFKKWEIGTNDFSSSFNQINAPRGLKTQKRTIMKVNLRWKMISLQFLPFQDLEWWHLKSVPLPLHRNIHTALREHSNIGFRIGCIVYTSQCLNSFFFEKF